MFDAHDFSMVEIPDNEATKPPAESFAETEFKEVLSPKERVTAPVAYDVSILRFSPVPTKPPAKDASLVPFLEAPELLTAPVAKLLVILVSTAFPIKPPAVASLSAPEYEPVIVTLPVA